MNQNSALNWIFIFLLYWLCRDSSWYIWLTIFFDKKYIWCFFFWQKKVYIVFFEAKKVYIVNNETYRFLFKWWIITETNNANFSEKIVFRLNEKIVGGSVFNSAYITTLSKKKECIYYKSDSCVVYDYYFLYLDILLVFLFQYSCFEQKCQKYALWKFWLERPR